MTGIELLKGLNTLLQNENLNNEMLQEASEGLLPALADYLNGCENHADGVTLIMKERFEQIEKHGYTKEIDMDNNIINQLSLGALLLLSVDYEEGIDPCSFPDGWSHEACNHMITKPYKERLIIAGALIAAELDRLEMIK